MKGKWSQTKISLSSPDICSKRICILFVLFLFFCNILQNKRGDKGRWSQKYQTQLIDIKKSKCFCARITQITKQNKRFTMAKTKFNTVELGVENMRYKKLIEQTLKDITERVERYKTKIQSTNQQVWYHKNQRTTAVATWLMLL